jgi:hypothetical protein
MEGAIHTTLLTSTLFLSSLLPQASSSAAISPLPTIGQESFRTVKDGDTLKTIAEDVYGDENGITFILQDNEWIIDPDHIEPGWMIKVRKNPLLMNSDSPETSELASEEVLLPSPTRTVMPQVQAVSYFATDSSVLASPTPSPVVTQSAGYAGGPLTEEQITYLGSCEAGMDPTKNTGNGFYGAFQFSYGTWQSMGTGYERADLAPLDVQKDAVQRLLSRSSIYTQFPACSRKMQSIGLL